MPKTTPKSSQVTTKSANQVLVGVVVLFFLALVVISFKYVMIKRSWNMYAIQTLHSVDNKRMMNSNEDAAVVAMTIGQFPTTEPLYKQPKEIQAYVTNFSKQTRRNLVVVDANKMVLADTVTENVGKKFADDKDNEVTKTIADGQERSFGLNQSVVALKDAAGKTVGAVILSSSPIFY